MFRLHCLTLLLSGSLTAATLTKDGRAVSVIVLPSEPSEVETLAARELAEHVEKISGAKVETANIASEKIDDFIGSSKAAGRLPILLGQTVIGPFEKSIRKVNELDGAFMLQVRSDRISVAGLGRGTLFGVYELLEQIGVRWFMPGELGSVIPSLKTVSVAQQETIRGPSFPGRYFQMNGAPPDWLRRMRCGGIPQFPSAHGLPGLARSAFKQHPEYFALIRGHRKARQHCVSNPEVIKIVVNAVKQWAAKNPGRPAFGMGPNDGAGFCECEHCRKLDGGDFDPFSGEESVTDRYVWFFNQVIDGIKDEYPDLKIGFYIYHNYMRPPVKVQPHPNITGALAPIALCRVHGPRNPCCNEKQYYEWLAREWGRLIPELWERGYWANLACPGFPFVLVHRLREQIPLGKEAGIKGWRVETFPNWGTYFPSFYIAAKLMWNAEADVDALMQDVYAKFFGPAAEPMGEYLNLMNSALREANYHTGCSWDMPYLYPETLRKDARKLLRKGAGKAKRKGIYEARVKMITETFDLLEHFIAMMDARVEVDFIAAQKHLEEMDAVAKKLMSYDPPMLVSSRFSTYRNYTRRFYRPCTEGGYKRVTGGNTMVAACKDEWNFLTDPLRVGEDLGFWKADASGANWQRIKTASRSWSTQGLRYYQGLAWYRQTVNVPSEFRGKRIFLWSGGVDEKAR
ncbi:MAG: DUF4838 domain-containing protein, partial [Planctomycetota bacterium]|nr:DUF4838 domain-containing protein [Planctomycetota bacterium]